MKKYLLSALLVGTMATGFAQSTSKINFKLEGGLNLATFMLDGDDADAYDDLIKVNPSFYASGVVNIPFSPKVSLQTGLTLGGKGVKIQESYSEGANNATADYRINILYLDIPANVVVTVPAGTGKFFVGAGPYLGIALSAKGKYKVSGTEDGQSISESDSEDLTIGSNDGDIRPIDFGIGGVLGYQLPMGLSANVRYGMGFLNVGSGATGNTSAKNGVLSFGLGYSF